jgi:hypothetical protein
MTKGLRHCKIELYEYLLKEAHYVDLLTLLQDKKKKANENNKQFQKAGKVKVANTKMPVRKAGRGK